MYYDFFTCKSILYFFCWDTSVYCIWLNVFCNHRTCCNYCTITYFNTYHDNCPCSNPYIISYYRFMQLFPTGKYHWNSRMAEIMVSSYDADIICNHGKISNRNFGINDASWANI